MKTNLIYRSIFSIILPISLLFLVFSKWSIINESVNNQWNSNREHNISGLSKDNDKQKGAHVFGIIDSTDFKPLIQQNLEWITLVSWAFQKDYDSPSVGHHNGDSLYIMEHNAHWIRKINQVQAAGFKVFLKPHLWINSPSDGKWRSDIFPLNDKDWDIWKRTYRDFILRYAKIAEETDVEMFCIGVEFSRLSVEKPLFWQNLIEEVRAIYSGKLTYAANWYNEFEKITFWNELDFIGIQAYFPLTKNKNPSVEQISKGWKRHLRSMKSIHEKYNRQIIFTEMGYKSTTNSAMKPWEWLEKTMYSASDFSPQTQANCYEAFFNTVWNKRWFAGVHIWQLRSDFINKNGKNNLDFTPQGKPAESIISKGFE